MSGIDQIWKANLNDYESIALGSDELGSFKTRRSARHGHEFWWKPPPGEMNDYPPLTWVKPETQQKILEKCDKEVKACEGRVMRLNGGFPLCGALEDGGQLSEAKEEWRKARIQRYWCRGDLGLN
jgi:hypothetical protein